MSSHRLHDPAFIQARYRLNGHARDVSGHGRHGTLVNAPTWGTFFKGNKTALELNGNNQYVNLGDLTCLNAVSAFTICFWMNQDVIGASDRLFYKYVNDFNRLVLYTVLAGTNRMYFQIPDGALAAYGFCVYDATVSAVNWHHVAWVYTGAGIANADRLICYIDGIPIALVFAGTIPATTTDLAGADATIGYSVLSFDGRLYDFRIYNVPLSRQEIMTIQHEPVGVL